MTDYRINFEYKMKGFAIFNAESKEEAERLFWLMENSDWDDDIEEWDDNLLNGPEEAMDGDCVITSIEIEPSEEE